MTMVPKISIITPSYNQAQYLRATLESIHGQAYPSLEHIVIDGGSTDGSVNVIQEYNDSLTYWESVKDRGQSDAINKGLRLATGEIVAWLNSDDVLMPGTLQRVAAVFSSHPEVDVVFGDYDLIDASGMVLETKREIPFHFNTILFGTNYIGQPTVFVRRRVVESVGLLDETLHYAMDWEWWLRMAASGYRFLHLRHVMAGCRWHSECKTVIAPARFAHECSMVRLRFWQPRLLVTMAPHIERFLRVIYRVRRQLVKLALRRTMDVPGRTLKLRTKSLL